MEIPLVGEMIEAMARSSRERAAEISNVRDGPIEDNKSFVLFDFRGKTYRFAEGNDVILTGHYDQFLKKAAKRYIAARPEKWIG